jgi:hypothetical protein
VTVLQPEELFAVLERHQVDDVIRSKEAADRPKDQRALQMLLQLRAEIRKRKPTGR